MAIEWEKGSNPFGGGAIHFCSCGFWSVLCDAVPLISWWRQCLSLQSCGIRVYLQLSQVSQPGTEHLKEALTLFWIRLTWFMWAGCGFVSLLWHSFFHVSLFMRIWRWLLRACGCSLKQWYDGWAWSPTSENLPLDESLVAHLIPIRTWCTRPLILVTERNLRAD